MAYVSLPEFTDYVGSEIVANQTALATALAAAESAIDEHCGRTFTVAEVTSLTRVYRPYSSTVTYIDDIADDTNLVVADDGTAVALTDLQLEPLNGLTPSGAVTAYHTLRRIGGGCWSGNGWEATVSVTSTRWGWVAVPAKVKEATLVLGKDFASLRDTRFGVAGWGEFGVVRMRQNPQVLHLLRGFEHPRAVLVA